MLILDGKQVSEARKQKLRPEVQQLTQKLGRAPCLCVVLVGEDPASQVYVRNKIKACESVGIHSILRSLKSTATQDELESLLHQLNRDSSVDGILVQLPLPKHLYEERMNEIISPEKDVDGFSYQSLGHLFAGTPIVLPCTPQGVISILEHYKIPLEGKNVVVVGRSNIVGKPMAQLLLMKNSTVTICHSKTKNMKDFTKNADIVVVAAGRKKFLGKEDFKKGAVVIDVGIHRDQDGLCGDVRFEELQGWAEAATPVPGGVGPMTIMTLLENTVQLAKRKR